MKKKDKTPTEKQNKKSQSQSKVHKAGTSFDPETWKQLENGTRALRSLCKKLKAPSHSLSVNEFCCVRMQ